MDLLPVAQINLAMIKTGFDPVLNSVVGARLSSAPAQLSHRSRFFGSAWLPEPSIAGSGYDFEVTDTLHLVMPPQVL